MAKVTINIVSWNGLRFLPEALETIYAQTFKDFEIIIVDNGSTDGTVDYIRNNYPRITFLRNFKNLGFTRAYNQTIKLSMARWKKEELDQKFILITNQDILLEPDYLEKLVSAARANRQGATFGGKLLRAFFKPTDDEFEEKIKSGIIDSTGLVMKRSRRVFDRGAGENDQGQYDQDREVFGICGAIMLARASALEDVKFKEEYFDENFFSYKEDIDLAWRLRMGGWKNYFVPEARAFHFRGAYSPAKAGIRRAIELRRRRPFLIKFHSFSNHHLVLVKNSYLRHLVRDLPWILLNETKRIIYSIFFEPRVLIRGTSNFFGNLSAILGKRKFVFSRLNTDPKEISKWIK